MPLLDPTGEIDDLWPRIADEAPLPARGRALIGPARLAEAAARPLELGLALGPGADVGTLDPWLGRLALVEVAFPAFSDGRGFSIGRRLRERGFRGRLRAAGPLIADQFAHLVACGFEEALLPADVARRQPPGAWQAAARTARAGYQRGFGAGSILERRHGHG